MNSHRNLDNTNLLSLKDTPLQDDADDEESDEEKEINSPNTVPSLPIEEGMLFGIGSNFLLGGGDSSVSTNMQAPSSNIVGISDTQTLTNKSLDNNTTVHVDTSDTTKQIKFSTSGAA